MTKPTSFVILSYGTVQEFISNNNNEANKCFDFSESNNIVIKGIYCRSWKQYILRQKEIFGKCELVLHLPNINAQDYYHMVYRFYSSNQYNCWTNRYDHGNNKQYFKTLSIREIDHLVEFMSLYKSVITRGYYDATVFSGKHIAIKKSNGKKYIVDVNVTNNRYVFQPINPNLMMAIVLSDGTVKVVRFDNTYPHWINVNLNIGMCSSSSIENVSESNPTNDPNDPTDQSIN